jgi:hypothetical protein
MISRIFSPSPSGPPRTTKPSSTRTFMNTACSSHCSRLSHGKQSVPMLSPLSGESVISHGLLSHRHLLVSETRPRVLLGLMPAQHPGTESARFTHVQSTTFHTHAASDMAKVWLFRRSAFPV